MVHAYKGQIHFLNLGASANNIKAGDQQITRNNSPENHINMCSNHMKSVEMNEA
jgi:hypothetical protein